jgi:hypothetical protein
VTPSCCSACGGIGRDEFIALLRTDSASEPGRAKAKREAQPIHAEQPLTTDPQRFWHGVSLSESLYGTVEVLPEGAPLARRLGSFPFWHGNTDFLEFVSRVSSAAAQRGLDILLKH